MNNLFIPPPVRTVFMSTILFYFPMLYILENMIDISPFSLCIFVVFPFLLNIMLAGFILMVFQWLSASHLLLYLQYTLFP
jgi:hypothetical protein